MLFVLHASMLRACGTLLKPNPCQDCSLSTLPSVTQCTSVSRTRLSTPLSQASSHARQFYYLCVRVCSEPLTMHACRRFCWCPTWSRGQRGAGAFPQTPLWWTLLAAAMPAMPLMRQAMYGRGASTTMASLGCRDRSAAPLCSVYVAHLDTLGNIFGVL